MCLMEQKTCPGQHREAPGRKADLALLEENFIYLGNFIVDVLVTTTTKKPTQKTPTKIPTNPAPLLAMLLPKVGHCGSGQGQGLLGGCHQLPVTLSATLLPAKAQNPRH